MLPIRNFPRIEACFLPDQVCGVFGPPEPHCIQPAKCRRSFGPPDRAPVGVQKAQLEYWGAFEILSRITHDELGLTFHITSHHAILLGHHAGHTRRGWQSFWIICSKRHHHVLPSQKQSRTNPIGASGPASDIWR